MTLNLEALGVIAVLSFFIGSIPSGLLIAKSKGIDLTKVGSGNIGATNVLRAVGKKEALLTLILDIAKGLLPVVIAKKLFPEFTYEATAGIFAILGHNFSVFLRFKGGKGVAASIGAVLGISGHVGLFTITLWLITAKWSRYSSLSALVAFGLLPLSFYLIDYTSEKVIFACLVTVLIFLRHTSNIKRLLAGTESKIGQKAT